MIRLDMILNGRAAEGGLGTGRRGRFRNGPPRAAAPTVGAGPLAGPPEEDCLNGG